MADQLGTDGRARHAVVIGSGIAGLLAASVLAEYAQRVTVVERDRLPDGPELRPGVPQGRHTHVLLEGGQVALEQLLPGVLGELRAQGAPEVGLPGDVVQWQNGYWFRRTPATTHMFTGTRPRLEHIVRRRVLANPRIEVADGTEVAGLTGDDKRVRGVLLRERGAGRGAGRGGERNGERNGERSLDADLVVDASGRGSRAPEWLAAMGAEPPHEETIDTGLAYATRLYRDGSNGHLADCLGYFVVPCPTQTHGGVIMPVEDDGLHLVTLSGLRGDEPPTDAEAFEKFAETLPRSVLSEWLAKAEPQTAVHSFRKTANVRRRYDRPGRRPAGFLAIGDAMCTFNPVYGQGMAVAAISAVALRDALADPRRTPTTRRVQRALFTASAQAWDISAGSDKNMPGAVGNAVGSRIADRPALWYLRRVQARYPADPVVGAAFRRVLSLAAPISALFAPDVARVVLFAPVAETPDGPPQLPERAT
ncbi:FAD-dependent oxidoreductase [Streptomyces sp. NPDC052236]|uniref:FAD-dependent oxidoreductase n=1 Tax=Streptomyces sp. NPDC052236 TaxID=3365686 RepID=UPI0037D27B9C